METFFNGALFTTYIVTSCNFVIFLIFLLLMYDADAFKTCRYLWPMICRYGTENPDLPHRFSDPQYCLPKGNILKNILNYNKKNTKRIPGWSWDRGRGWSPAGRWDRRGRCRRRARWRGWCCSPRPSAPWYTQHTKYQHPRYIRTF